jgi:DNA-binding transcriptional ArsR family regulator
VCSLCSAIKYASAPMWAACTKMSGGPRGVWLAIWTCADRDTTSPDEVYPSNERIGERAGGVSARTVQRHLEQLEIDGWIRVSERKGRRYIRLAWAEPREDWKVLAAIEAADRHRDRIVADRDGFVAWAVESDTATGSSPTATVSSQQATGSSPASDRIVAHTLHDLGTTLEDHLGPRERGDVPDPGVDASRSQPREPRPSPSEMPRSPVFEADRETSSSPPSPSPRPRKRKPARSRQQGLDLPDTEPIDPLEIAHAELLADHERFRAEAMAHHRVNTPAWPAPFTEAGRSIRTGLRQALREHGVDACRRALAWQAASWKRDSTKLKHSLVTMWSADALAWVIPASAGQAQARASPNKPRGPTLSCEPMPGEMPRFVYDKNGECL